MSKKNQSQGHRGQSEFVAEQSGLFWSTFGILIALVISLTVKSMMAPQRIKARIDEAARNIHRDLQVSVGEASISLADGFVPELAIHVRNVRLETQKECWGGAVAEIDEMKLPLRFFDLLSGVVRFEELNVGEVNLSLKSPLKKCEGAPATTSSVNTETAVAEPKLKADTPVKDALIDEVSIKRLRVTYLPLALTSFELSNLSVQVLNHSPLELRLLSQVNLFGETLSGDYASFGDLQLTILEKKKIEGQISGVWREGQYKLAVTVDLEKSLSQASIEAQHLSLRQIFPLLRKYNLMHQDFDPLQSWLSVKAEVLGPSEDFSKWKGQVQKLRLEGDLGVIETQPIEIHSLNPVKTSAVDIQLKPLMMDSLVAMVRGGKKPQFLGSLGQLTGSGRFLNENDLELTGDHSGLEFLFSNRGVRKTQTISLFSGDLSLKGDLWKLKIQRVRPLEGIFDGIVQVEADREWTDVRVKADVREVILSQEIQKLMTVGGHLGPMDGEFNVQLEKGLLKSLQAEARWDDLRMEGLELGRVYLVGQGNQDKMSFQIRTRGVSLSDQSSYLKAIDPALHKFFVGKYFEAGSFTLAWETPRILQWSGARLSSASTVIESQGQIGEQGDLLGQLRFRERGLSQLWKIEGQKDRPLWMKQ
ncbi:MAG: AsmA family protein [Pseudobdellovibrionaceae bacterium]